MLPDKLLSILIILLACLIFFGPFLYLKIKNNQRRKRHLKIHNQIDALFQETNPYQLSVQERTQLGMQDQKYVYGEVPAFIMLELQHNLNLPKSAHFIDLGSGCGKVVYALALTGRYGVCSGVEILESLHELAKSKLSAIESMSSRPVQLKFEVGDFMQASLDLADLLLINATSLPKDLWQIMIEKLKTLKKGAKIIVISKKLDSDDFKLIYQATEPMSWGPASTRIYEKI